MNHPIEKCRYNQTKCKHINLKSKQHKPQTAIKHYTANNNIGIYNNVWCQTLSKTMLFMNQTRYRVQLSKQQYELVKPCLSVKK